MGNHRRSKQLLVLLMLVLPAGAAAGCTTNPTAQLNILAAYAQLDDVEAIDNDAGYRVGAGVDVAVGEQDNGAGPRLGGRLHVSQFNDTFSQLTVVTPQFVASYRAIFGDPDAWALFIEPGAAVGLALGNYEEEGFFVDEDSSETSYSLNPFLRGGFQLDRLLIGIEAGYQFTGFEFSDGSEVAEWYAGLFLAFQLTRD